MIPDPDRPAPAPSPLADRLADLQGSAEWIDARQLTPVIDHAERVEAEMTAARREATTLRAALEEIARLEPLGSGMKLIVHGSSAREVALAAMAAGLPPDGRPAGDAGEPPAAPGIDAQRGGTPAVGAFIYAGRLGMNLDVGPEMIAFRRSLDRPGDAQAQFEAAVSRLVEHDRAGPTVAALHQAIQVAANLMAAWAEDLEAGGDEAEIIDHMRCAAREARAVIGVPKSVIDAGSDSPDPAPAALRAQAEDYRAKWEDALTRLDAVTGTLALYGRRAEAGRELARAVVDATGTRDAFADLRAMALRVLARPIGERDGDETPEKARPAIVCLSGSTRFVEHMAVVAWEEEKRGRIALSCHLLPSWYGAEADHQAEAEGVAEAMDALHLRKIDLADEILVVNCGGYIGDSTRREIAYARSLGKPVRFLEPPETPRDGSEATPEPPADPGGSGPSDRTTGLPGGLAGPSPGPASPRACPFCGTEATPEPLVVGEDYERSPYAWQTKCPECWARGPYTEHSEAAALAAWDRRAEAGAAPGEKAADRGCPCLYTTPCHARCPCLGHPSSLACRRCCRCGNDDQRRAKAERLAALIDEPGRLVVSGIPRPPVHDRLGMNYDLAPETITFRRAIDRPGDACAQFEAAINRLMDADRHVSDASLGIAPGAVQLLAERIVRGLAVGDWTEGDGDWVPPTELVARILRESLGLVPAAGRGGDEGGGRDAD